MKINFNSSSIESMMQWLEERKKGITDEKKLREILSHPDYAIEFARYGQTGLPVCGIDFEEAVDFFLHFDEKNFENARLQYKKKDFLAFYENLERDKELLESIQNITEDDLELISQLLRNGLPEDFLEKLGDIHIIFAISIGNSMGWPYENYIDFDVANLNIFGDKNSFLHIIAHEIYHMFFSELIGEEMTPEQFFLVNFAFEGLAVHFCNNQSTLYKPSKYKDCIYGMSQSDMAYYEKDFDYWFKMIQEDYQTCGNFSYEQVNELLGSHYENFNIHSNSMAKDEKISGQYPTYYFGCYLWGIIDYVFGKEKLFETLKHPDKFIDVYNQAAIKAKANTYLF